MIYLIFTNPLKISVIEIELYINSGSTKPAEIMFWIQSVKVTLLKCTSFVLNQLANTQAYNILFGLEV